MGKGLIESYKGKTIWLGMELNVSELKKTEFFTYNIDTFGVNESSSQDNKYLF